MPTYLTPGLYYETVDATSGAIAPVRTDIAAFLGIAERGRIGAAAPVTSWRQFASAFGTFTGSAYLAYSVKAFFENGGQKCYAVRVAAPEVVTNSAGAQPADRSSSIVATAQGFASGAAVTVEQGAFRRTRRAVRVDSVTRTLFWETPLENELNLADPITFRSGLGTATVELPDATGLPTLRVSAASGGSWGNDIGVRVGRSTGASTSTRSAIQPADRQSSLVESVQEFAAGALVRIFQGSPASLTAHRIVAAVGHVDRSLAWDQALDAAFDLTSGISFEVVEFSITVYAARRVAEMFSRLSLVPENSRYVSRVISADASSLIRVEDLQLGAPMPDRLPVAEYAFLAAGRDGLAALRTLDFTGAPSSVTKVGIRTLEDVDEVFSVAAPDIHIRPTPPVLRDPLPPPGIDPCSLEPPLTLETPAPPPPLLETPPVFTEEQVFRVQQALVEHCESLRDRLAVLDPPLEDGRDSVLDPGEIVSWRNRFDSKYAALYYPWVAVYDPRFADGSLRNIPPSGHVLGIYARGDLAVGVHKAPANEELEWAQDTTIDVSAALQSALNPNGVNCIRSFPGRGLRLYGARTISSSALWQFVNVRRLLMMIEESVEEALQWTVFEPNDFALREGLRMTVSNFLEMLWRRGALAGSTRQEAYFVRCDEGNNTPSMSATGQLLAEVGVASAMPAEFVVFRVGRLREDLEIVE